VRKPEKPDRPDETETRSEEIVTDGIKFIKLDMCRALHRVHGLFFARILMLNIFGFKPWFILSHHIVLGTHVLDTLSSVLQNLTVTLAEPIPLIVTDDLLGD
jgi:hypothetical protein